MAMGTELSHRFVPIQESKGCGALSESELIRMSKSYYESFGPWSGIFWLDSAEKYRIEHRGPKELRFHLRYKYVPIPQNPLQRTDTGYDQRIFHFSCAETWQVNQLDAFMSASFEE